MISGLVFEQTAGPHGPAKLTQKISHHTSKRSSVSALTWGDFFVGFSLPLEDAEFICHDHMDL